MKKIFFLLPTLVLFVSCKKPAVTVDISFTTSLSSNFTLPKLSDTVVAVPDSLVMYTTPSMTNTLPDEFKKNNADINHIKSASIQSIELDIQSPSNQDFSFMKTINVYLGATGVGEVLIASKDNINLISPPPTSLNLDVANADISNYIKSPTYYLKIETRLVKTYIHDIGVASTIKFKVVASPL